MLKLFSAENVQVRSKSGPKMAVFGEKGDVDVKFMVLRPPKGTSLRRTASFDVFCIDVRGGVLAVGDC